MFEERLNCPCCGRGQWRSIFGPVRYDDPRILTILNTTVAGRIDRFFLIPLIKDEQYELLKCEYCALVWQKNIPGKEVSDILYGSIDLENMYDLSREEMLEVWRAMEERFGICADIGAERSLDLGGLYEEKEASKKKCDAVSDQVKNNVTYLQELHHIYHYFKRQRPIKVLDYGMGWARWCIVARLFNFDTCGVEVAEEKIRHAKQYGIRTLDADEIADYRFDFINVHQVLEHVPSPYDTLESLKQSLNNGGIIRVSVPDGRSIEAGLMNESWHVARGQPGSLNALRPLRHINCFRRESLLRLAERCGMKIFHYPMGLIWDHSLVAGGISKFLQTQLRFLYRRTRFYKRTDVLLTRQWGNRGQA